MTDTMEAAVVTEPGEITITERDIPEPDSDEVLIDVKASGICHSDKYAVKGDHPAATQPRIPGHEVVGVVQETGSNVEIWNPGDRVGLGWHGGHCFTCQQCRRGDFVNCNNRTVTGLDRDGGHAEYVTARSEALARVPTKLDWTDAAPLMCAGVTTYNALRQTEVNPGDTVAVLGIGGLGHLGIQYAAASGYKTIALSHTPDKESYARKLGAHHFIDTSSADTVEQLNELGGADVLLSTAPVASAIEDVIGGLATNGEAMVVGVPGEPVKVQIGDLVGKSARIAGWSTGHGRDNQDTLEFSAQEGITPETELYSLDEYRDAYDRMMENNVRFRAVLDI
ncbi:MAG: alcohol dehydrogenase catalytic domain-containing protein [Candidatus Nanohaloarchaea archaeon]|nr:alcohol dehydrogenase catalytic domain-containing protein [Candidatus Nanohaloarchaea archaeon]